MSNETSTGKRHFVYDHKIDAWYEPATNIWVSWFGCPVWAWLCVNCIEPDYWLTEDGKLIRGGQ